MYAIDIDSSIPPTDSELVPLPLGRRESSGSHCWRETQISDLEKTMKQMEALSQRLESNLRGLGDLNESLNTDVQIEVVPRPAISPYFSGQDLRKILGNLRYFGQLQETEPGNNIYTLVSCLKKIEECEGIGKPLLEDIISSHKKLSFHLIGHKESSFNPLENEATVLLNLSQKPDFVHVLKEGRCELEKQRDDVVLYHELVHCYHWISDQEKYFGLRNVQSLLSAQGPFCPCYSNLEEFYTISGKDCSSSQNRNTSSFSENAYRQTQGLSPRISHRGYSENEVRLVLQAREKFYRGQAQDISAEEILQILSKGLSGCLKKILDRPEFNRKRAITEKDFLAFLTFILKEKKSSDLPQNTPLDMFNDLRLYLITQAPEMAASIRKNPLFQKELSVAGPEYNQEWAASIEKDNRLAAGLALGVFLVAGTFFIL